MLPLWFNIYYNVKQKDLNIALESMYESITDRLSQQDFNVVDDILLHVDTNKLPIILKIGLLRITFPAKHKLQHWKHRLLIIKKELIKLNKNHNKLLIGLLS
jgi:hypothetical protein